MKNILYITLVSCIGLTIMISCSEKEESSSSSSSITEDISFDPSSVPDNGTTVVFWSELSVPGDHRQQLFRDDHIFSEQSA